MERINGQTASRGEENVFLSQSTYEKLIQTKSAAINLLILANYREVAGAVRETARQKVAQKLPTRLRREPLPARGSWALGLETGLSLQTLSLLDHTAFLVKSGGVGVGNGWAMNGEDWTLMLG